MSQKRRNIFFFSHIYICLGSRRMHIITDKNHFQLIKRFPNADDINGTVENVTISFSSSDRTFPSFIWKYSRTVTPIFSNWISNRPRPGAFRRTTKYVSYSTQRLLLFKFINEFFFIYPFRIVCCVCFAERLGEFSKARLFACLSRSDMWFVQKANALYS